MNYKKMVLRSFVLTVLVVLTLGCCNNSKVEKKIGYINPIAAQRADPWMYKNDDGEYYFIATVPEYDRIEIRKSNTINGIGTADPVVVWKKHAEGVMGGFIWAPELHKYDGKWYIYFAAGEAENVWKIRMFVLSNESEDPTQGEWVEEGRVFTQKDSFSLDATNFEHKGELYYIWAQGVREGENTSLLISKMESPVKLKGPEVIICDPKLDWEQVGYKVNEGPAVLKKNGKIFVTYSASATDANYCIGMLWADENADLLDPKSWHKSEQPVFYTNKDARRFGPGHSCFTVAEDGKTDVLIYHARVYEQIRGNSLFDFNRHTRARTINWDENGFPDFRQNEAD